MRKTEEKGSFVEWLLMLLALSVVIFGVLIPKGERNFFLGLPNIGAGSYTTEDNGGVRGTSIPSAFSNGEIRLGTGNSRYSKDPMDEYITIDNSSSRPISITNWRLENGKGARTYTLGGQTLQYASDTAIIPQGTKVISPNGRNNLESIILKPGEQAIVTTGGPGNISPYTIVSFKENLCTGYLKEDYQFAGGLEKSCVRPVSEPGVASLDKACRDYIANMQSCNVPEFGGRDSAGERCNNCVDGRSDLSSACVSFIKAHYDYPGCLSNHLGDSGFEGRVWHIYLHRPWEMWADSYETISLYDSSGALVTSYSY